MAGNIYRAIFEQAAIKAEEAARPTLKTIADIVYEKFTKQAGFTVSDNSPGCLYPATEIKIEAHNAIAGGGTARISAHGDGTFNIKFHLGDRDIRTSIEDVMEQLAQFYVHFKNPAPAQKAPQIIGGCR
jgi:hypothetical protein